MFGNICHPERIHRHPEHIHCHPERKRRISTTALAAILLTSCESIFDLDRLADENMFKMECMVVSQDTVALNLDIVVPLSDHDHQKPDIHQANVDVMIDGRPVLLQKATGAEGNLPIGSLFFSSEISPGAEVKVTATHEYVKSMVAETVMPEVFPDYDIVVNDLVADSVMSEQLYEVEMRFDEEQEGFFGIELLVDSVEDTSGVFYGHKTYSCEIFDPDAYEAASSGAIFGENPDWNSLTEVSYNGHTLYMFKAKSANVFRFRYSSEGNRIEYGYSYGYGDEYGYEETVTEVHYVNKCRFRLYRISEEYYYYSIRDINSLSSLGFSAPSQTYSNVTGGIGVLAGMTLIETPWQKEVTDLNR